MTPPPKPRIKAKVELIPPPSKAEQVVCSQSAYSRAGIIIPRINKVREAKKRLKEKEK